MLLFFLFACSSDVTFQGTLVGNPGRGDALVAAGKDITFHHASGRVNAAYYLPKATTFSGPVSEVVDTLDLDLNLLKSGDNIPLITGDWEAIGLEFSDGITITGETADGQSISLQTAEIFVELLSDNSIQIADQQYIIELGYPGWISSGNFGESSSLVVEADSSIADILNFQSGLFLDADKDGSISPQEREEQSLVEPETIPEEEDEEDEEEDWLEEEEEEEHWEAHEFPSIDDDELWDEWEEEAAAEEPEEANEDGCTDRSLVLLPLATLLGFRRRQKTPKKD